MKNWLFLILTTLSISTTFGQATGIDQWQDHLPYSNGQKVAYTANRIYCATNGGLFSIDKNERSILRHSRVNGASDIGVAAITPTPQNNGVVVGYQNGNIDIIYDNSSVTNVPDIKDARISGDKSIYDLEQYNDLIYIATGFGIVELNTATEEIAETYYLGSNADYIKSTDIIIHDDTLYAISDSGLYSISTIELIQRSTNWRKDLSLIDSISYINPFFIHNKLHLIASIDGFQNDSIITKRNGQWKKVNTFYQEGVTKEDFHSITVYSDTVLVANSTSIEMYDTTGTSLTRVFNYGNEKSVLPSHAIKENNRMYIADHANGLVISEGTFSNETYNPGGPGSSNAFYLYADLNTLYASRGGISGNTQTQQLRGGIYIFEEDEWTIYDQTNISAFDTVLDVVMAKPHPENSNIIYASSFRNGIVKLVNGTVEEIYNQSNSTLQKGYVGNVVQSTALDFDENNNLWVTNSLSNKPLHVFSNNEWYGFAVPSLGVGSIPGDLVVINEKRVAFSAIDYGCVIYDHNSTLADTTDDRYHILNSGNADLPSNVVTSLHVDHDGELWIGTFSGLRVVYNPSLENLTELKGEQILIDQDGQTKVLLEDQYVSRITTNAANEKWFGTYSGAFLMSPEGTREIASFDVTNSPMLSDRILSIAVINSTGEVFFGTEAGIISYRSETTAPWINMDQITAFPNPVPANYAGIIGIKGLMDNTRVKITDSSGRLVYEATSEGGQIAWDGNTLNGEKVSPGVYRIYCSEENGTQTGASNLLILGF